MSNLNDLKRTRKSERMFSLRIVSVNYSMRSPTADLDKVYSEFRGKQIHQVPVLEIYGATSAGHKGCLNIHGAFPYVYIPYDGAEPVDQVSYKIASGLDQALNVLLSQASAATCHVHSIEHVSAIPYYGYHENQHQFLKIYFYNPAIVKKACDLLQNGAILGKCYQPHEAHINYVMQFMIDHNLYGMSFIRVAHAHNTAQRRTVCELELDANVSEILNGRVELDGTSDILNGLASIWETERKRRQQSPDTQTSFRLTQNRTNAPPTDSDRMHRARFLELLAADSLGSSFRTSASKMVYPIETAVQSQAESDVSVTETDAALLGVLLQLKEDARAVEDDSILSQQQPEPKEDEDELDLSLPFQLSEDSIWGDHNIPEMEPTINNNSTKPNSDNLISQMDGNCDTEPDQDPDSDLNELNTLPMIQKRTKIPLNKNVKRLIKRKRFKLRINEKLLKKCAYWNLDGQNDSDLEERKFNSNKMFPGNIIDTSLNGIELNSGNNNNGKSKSVKGKYRPLPVRVKTKKFIEKKLSSPAAHSQKTESNKLLKSAECKNSDVIEKKETATIKPDIKRNTLDKPDVAQNQTTIPSNKSCDNTIRNNNTDEVGNNLKRKRSETKPVNNNNNTRSIFDDFETDEPVVTNGQLSSTDYNLFYGPVPETLSQQCAREESEPVSNTKTRNLTVAELYDLERNFAPQPSTSAMKQRYSSARKTKPVKQRSSGVIAAERLAPTPAEVRASIAGCWKATEPFHSDVDVGNLKLAKRCSLYELEQFDSAWFGLDLWRNNMFNTDCKSGLRLTLAGYEEFVLMPAELAPSPASIATETKPVATTEPPTIKSRKIHIPCSPGYDNSDDDSLSLTLTPCTPHTLTQEDKTECTPKQLNLIKNRKKLYENDSVNVTLTPLSLQVPKHIAKLKKMYDSLKCKRDRTDTSGEVSLSLMERIENSEGIDESSRNESLTNNSAKRIRKSFELTKESEMVSSPFSLIFENSTDILNESSDDSNQSSLTSDNLRNLIQGSKDALNEPLISNQSSLVTNNLKEHINSSSNANGSTFHDTLQLRKRIKTSNDEPSDDSKERTEKANYILNESSLIESNLTSDNLAVCSSVQLRKRSESLNLNAFISNGESPDGIVNDVNSTPPIKKSDDKSLRLSQSISTSKNPEEVLKDSMSLRKPLRRSKRINVLSNEEHVKTGNQSSSSYEHLIGIFDVSVNLGERIDHTKDVKVSCSSENLKTNDESLSSSQSENLRTFINVKKPVKRLKRFNVLSNVEEVKTDNSSQSTPTSENLIEMLDVFVDLGDRIDKQKVLSTSKRNLSNGSINLKKRTGRLKAINGPSEGESFNLSQPTTSNGSMNLRTRLVKLKESNNSSSNVEQIKTKNESINSSHLIGILDVSVNLGQRIESSKDIEALSSLEHIQTNESLNLRPATPTSETESLNGAKCFMKRTKKSEKVNVVSIPKQIKNNKDSLTETLNTSVSLKRHIKKSTDLNVLSNLRDGNDFLNAFNGTRNLRKRNQIGKSNKINVLPKTIDESIDLNLSNPTSDNFGEVVNSLRKRIGKSPNKTDDDLNQTFSTLNGLSKQIGKSNEVNGLSDFEFLKTDDTFLDLSQFSSASDNSRETLIDSRKQLETSKDLKVTPVCHSPRKGLNGSVKYTKSESDFSAEYVKSSQQSKQLNFTNSYQITDMTPTELCSLDNFQDCNITNEHQCLTILVVELHVETRAGLNPDPEYDAIQGLFYSIYNDVPVESGLPRRETGVILIGNGNQINWDQITCVESEVELITNFLELVQKWDPDIFTGYEIEMSSWGYLVERSAAIGLQVDRELSRLDLAHVKKQTDAVRDAQFVGRITLDAWRLFRHEVALQSYTFESVMYRILNERVPKYSFKQLTQWWKHPSTRHITAGYYLLRVTSLLRLLDQQDIIGRSCELARLFGIQFYEVFSRGSQFRVESMMLRLTKPKRFIAVSPSVEQRARMRAPESLPLILEPESKMYVDPVIVLDFQSLYPSIIIAYNYCFSTCVGRVDNIVRHLDDQSPFEFGATQLKVSRDHLDAIKDHITFSPCGVGFVDGEIRTGILPTMLSQILETRLMVKNAMKTKANRANKTLQKVLHNQQLGLKLIANVTYGYTAANYSGRMPCAEVADSVVSKGRETLQRAIRLIEDRADWAARVVYGDTDSIFVLVPGRNRSEAFALGAEMAEAVTASNPSPVRLKFEKVYQPCILQTKKRYVGYMYETVDQSQPVYDAKGIETVRRDGCPAVSKMLEKSLRILFDSRDVSLVKRYVCRQLSKVLSGRVSIQELTFAREYRGASHYRPGACVPALELIKRWTAVDRRREPRRAERVPYVVVHGAPGVPLIRLVRCPRELIHDPMRFRPNALYYITRVIIPALQRCFGLIGVDLFTWFNEMPRKQQFQSAFPSHANQLLDASKKHTISQYFAVTNCVVCSNYTREGLCSACLKQPQRTVVTLHEKIRCWEHAHDDILRICQSCCGRNDQQTFCSSLDCPIMYRLHQIECDMKQVPFIRNLLNEF